MNIASILDPKRTLSSVSVASKKAAIEYAAKHIAQSLPDLEVGDIYRGLVYREKLGTTAIGEGVAIPHCRLENCDSITGGLYVLRDPVDFSAPDDKGVQIMFVLLVPAAETSQHLATLAMLAERFEREDFRESLINADDNNDLYRRALQPLLPFVTQKSG
jgi:PTS system nitrogen regulatory IIA component